jgi:hypothetical protein
MIAVTKYPMQPIVEVDGIIRFKENAIVSFLLDNGGIDMNKISALGFSQEDRVQFAQLIGYSLSGFHELSYVPDDIALLASRIAKEAGFNGEGCRDRGCKIHSGITEC